MSTTTKSRYEVRKITNAEASSYGELILATDDASAAKVAANRAAHSCYYGTAILDTVARTADIGSEILPLD